jgi:hypothetical protein
VRERAVVFCAVFLFHTRKLKARIRVGRVDADKEKSFVVTEADIVFRPVFLDQNSKSQMLSMSARVLRSAVIARDGIK